MLRLVAALLGVAITFTAYVVFVHPFTPSGEDCESSVDSFTGRDNSCPEKGDVETLRNRICRNNDEQQKRVDKIVTQRFGACKGLIKSAMARDAGTILVLKEPAQKVALNTNKIVCLHDASAQEKCSHGASMQASRCECPHGLARVAIENPISRTTAVGCAKEIDTSSILIKLSTPIRNELVQAFLGLHKRILYACTSHQVQDRLGSDCGKLPFEALLAIFEISENNRSIDSGARFYRAVHRKLQTVQLPATLVGKLEEL